MVVPVLRIVVVILVHANQATKGSTVQVISFNKIYDLP